MTPPPLHPSAEMKRPDWFPTEPVGDEPRSPAVFGRIQWELEKVRWYGVVGWFAERRRRKKRTATVSQIASRGRRVYPRVVTSRKKR